VRLYVPYTDEREIQEVARVLATGYLTQGPKVAEFEAMIARRIGSRHAFAMSSCTTALHLALVALGIGPGRGRGGIDHEGCKSMLEEEIHEKEKK